MEAFEMQTIDINDYTKLLKNKVIELQKEQSPKKSSQIDEVFGMGKGIVGKSKLELEKDSNLGQFIKQNMNYFLMNFGFSYNDQAKKSPQISASIAEVPSPQGNSPNNNQPTLNNNA